MVFRGRVFSIHTNLVGILIHHPVHNNVKLFVDISKHTKESPPAQYLNSVVDVKVIHSASHNGIVHAVSYYVVHTTGVTYTGKIKEVITTCSNSKFVVIESEQLSMNPRRPSTDTDAVSLAVVCHGDRLLCWYKDALTVGTNVEFKTDPLVGVNLKADECPRCRFKSNGRSMVVSFITRIDSVDMLPRQYPLVIPPVSRPQNQHVIHEVTERERARSRSRESDREAVDRLFREKDHVEKPMRTTMMHNFLQRPSIISIFGRFISQHTYDNTLRLVQQIHDQQLQTKDLELAATHSEYRMHNETQLLFKLQADKMSEFTLRNEVSRILKEPDTLAGRMQDSVFREMIAEVTYHSLQVGNDGEMYDRECRATSKRLIGELIASGQIGSKTKLCEMYQHYKPCETSTKYEIDAIKFLLEAVVAYAAQF